MDESSYKKFLEGAKTFILKFIDVLAIAHKWYEKNADNIVEYIKTFENFAVWCSATEKLAKKQIVFTDDLTLEMAKEIKYSADIDKFIQNYYFENDNRNLIMLIERCQASNLIKEYKILFTQILDSYNKEHYQLACLGLFSILDGLLSDVSNNNTTSFNKRINVVEKKLKDKVELNEIDRKTLCIYTAIEKIDNTPFKFFDFSQDEPNGLNRHWLLHGRTRKEYSKYDFLKIMLWVDGLDYLNQIKN